MIVKRFYDTQLAQTSYLIGCGRTGSAVVIDANRNIEQYIAMAAAEGVAITHVTETHIHADFVSGSRELAQRTGATLYLSDEGDANWKYAFVERDHAVLLHDGDTFRVGNIVMTVMHTPGHTPEHLSFLVTDTAAASEPIAIVTGDFVFVGDVGRPDLLEKAAKIRGTMDGAARTLYGSLKRLAELPDWLQIWPGHGAGSACGKGLSAVPHSTLGYERRFNWAFSMKAEDEFVAAVLDGQPDPPTYFAEMKRINKAGPDIRGTPDTPARYAAGQLTTVLPRTDDVVVIDSRSAADFAAGHIPGTINIPRNNSFVTWAGWLVPYTKDIVLIVSDGDANTVRAAMDSLSLIGLDRVVGFADTTTIAEWQSRHGALELVPQLTASQTAEGMSAGTIHVVDVRARSEWEAGHLSGVPNIPLGQLADRLDELPRDEPLVLHCQSGARSAIASSVLQAHGFSNVANMTGGIVAWTASGLPVDTEQGAMA